MDSLAHNLYELLQGNATAAILVYSGKQALAYQDEANEFTTLNDGRSGPEF